MEATIAPDRAEQMGISAKSVSPLVVAFVQGARWWEWISSGATMWGSDVRRAEEAALIREKENTLGELPNWLK